MESNNNMQIIQTIEKAIIDLGSTINKLERAHLDLIAETTSDKKVAKSFSLILLRLSGVALAFAGAVQHDAFAIALGAFITWLSFKEAEGGAA